MITIILDGVPDTNYYSDVFLKSFRVSPTPAGLVGTITVLANVNGQTSQQVQDKLDAVTTFGISVTDSGNRNGEYVVSETPTIVPTEVPSVVFVGTRLFKPKAGANNS